MHNDILCTLNCLKCLLDNMLSCLCQNLNRHIIRNQILLDQCTAELVFCLRSCRETNLDFLEAYTYQFFEKFKLLIQTHWNDQRLITITQIYAAPCWRLIDILFVYPVCTLYRRHIIATLVMLKILHLSTSIHKKINLCLQQLLRDASFIILTSYAVPL